MDWYKEELLDHYRFPRHKGKLLHSDLKWDKSNPACGDYVCFEAKIANGYIVEIAFEGAGCVISQATASMLAQKAYGQSVEWIAQVTGADITALIGMELGPTRLKCALLPLYTIQEGLHHYLNRQ